MPKQVLIFTQSWGYGGIESFVCNMIRSLPEDEFQFTVYSNWRWAPHAEELFRARGVEQVWLFEKDVPSLFKRHWEGRRFFKEILTRHAYDIVHVNAMNGAELAYTRIASDAGVPRVIAHAHNTGFGAGNRMVKTAAHKVGKHLSAQSSDTRLACSEEAGRFLFGDDSFRVLHNGFDTQAFSLNEEARRSVRDELGIPQDAFVVGTIGRVEEAKNPLFIVEAFERYRQSHPDAWLLLVGDGALRATRDARIRELGLSEVAAVVGMTPNPAPYYSALDCFLLPSLHEGSPFGVLEAQSSGAPVVASEALSASSVVVPDAVQVVPLDAGAPAWADAIERARALCDSALRTDRADLLAQSPYSLSAFERDLAQIYHA